MKAAVLFVIKQFEIRQIRKPEIVKDTDVLINMKTIGICGSDINYYTAGRRC